MATPDETIRERMESGKGSARHYKQAAFACLAEIQATVERIHRRQEERAPSRPSDHVIVQLLDETQQRIQQQQQVIRRLQTEIAALQAQLSAA